MTQASVLRFLRTHPVTIGLVLVLTVGSAVAGRAVEKAGELSPIPVDAVLSLVTVGQPATFVASLVGLLAVIPAAERLMGSVRTALAFLVSGILGFVVGASIVALTTAAGVVWADDAGSGALVDPVVGVAGAALAASAFAGPLWQRRIRILGFGILALLLLYSGNAADLYRILAAVVGVALGELFVRGTARPAANRGSSGHEIRTLLGFVVLATAVSPLITLWTRTPHGPLHVLSRLLLEGESPAGGETCPVDVGVVCSAAATHGIHGPGGVLLSVLPLLVLAVAGWGIFRGRRVAALIAAAVTALFGVLEFVYFAALRLVAPELLADTPAVRGEEILGAVVAIGAPLAVAVALLLNLRRFPVSPGRRAGRLFGAGVVVSLVGAAAVYVVGALALADRFEPRATPAAILATLPERFIPAGFLHSRLVEFVPIDAASKTLQEWVGPLFWAALLVGTVAVVARRAEGRSPVTQDLVRTLLRAGGRGSLSFMATWDGNAYWRHPGGAGVVAYRRSGRVVIVLGDPIGPAARQGEVVRDFIDYCAGRGDLVGFYAVGDESVSTFTDLGWQLLVIGEDARIDAAAFTLQGGRWKDIRTSMNRAAREGVEARWTSWNELATGMRSQLVDISEEWLSGKDIPEMGFTLGGIDELRDPAVRIMLAVHPDGRVTAATSWLPTYRDGRVVGWTLDLMRRRDGSTNGEMEMLIAETVLRAQREGQEFVSLSAAPLSRIAPGTPGSEGAARLLEGLGSRLEKLYHFRSLLTYKLKFAPELRPLYLAYSDATAIPAMGIALVRAYLPGLTAKQLLAMTRELADRPREPEPAR